MPDPLTRADQLAKVPETLTRDQYRSLIESVGIPVNDLVELMFHTDSIEAVVFARDEHGERYWANDTGDVATHTISIKVVG